MALQDRIKEARIKAGLNQKQVAEMIEITKSTVSEYESGKKVPTMNVLYRLMKALNVDANYLFQDEMRERPFTKTEPSPEEYEIIDKYRSLDKYGKDIVKTVLDKEVSRCQEQYVETERERLHRLVDEQFDLEKRAEEESEDSISG